MSVIGIMKRFVASVSIVVAAISLTGCMTILTEIKIRGDGSGTMVQTMTVNPEQMKESVGSVAKQMGATTTEMKEGTKEETKEESSKAAEEGPFKEDDFRSKAADLGKGVTFVSAEKIDTKTAFGARVTYAFEDINQLTVNPKPAAAMGAVSADASSQDAMKFKFHRVTEGNSVLRVIFANPKPDAAKEQAAAPPPPDTPEASAEQMAMMRQMFKGFRIGMTVEVEGHVVRTNSPYVEGSKVTLMDIDFDPLLSDEETLKVLNEKIGTTMGDDRKTMEALKGVKGIKVVTDPEVSIEFASH